MGKTPKDEWRLKQVQPKNSSEQWYFRKNLNPAIRPGDKEYPFIAYLTFVYSSPDESGLPTTNDNAILYRIEKEEITCLEECGLSIQVASVLKAGIKDLLFYTRDPDEFFLMAENFRMHYPQFKVACEILTDESWSHYKEFP